MQPEIIKAGVGNHFFVLIGEKFHNYLVLFKDIFTSHGLRGNLPHLLLVRFSDPKISSPRLETLANHRSFKRGTDIPLVALKT